jgi:hypothetical protein
LEDRVTDVATSIPFQLTATTTATLVLTLSWDPTRGPLALFLIHQPPPGGGYDEPAFLGGETDPVASPIVARIPVVADGTYRFEVAYVGYDYQVSIPFKLATALE